MAMQRNYFTVLFFLKKSKLLKNGEAPICMRITINGKRAEVQIKRSIDVTKWNTQKECAIGREKKYQEINHYLDTIRTKILQIHRELEQDGKPITADIIKNIYYGEHSTPKMLLEVFQEHNSEYRELMNKEYAEGTVLRYERTARYLKEFISEQYNLAGQPLIIITATLLRPGSRYAQQKGKHHQNLLHVLLFNGCLFFHSFLYFISPVNGAVPGVRPSK